MFCVLYEIKIRFYDYLISHASEMLHIEFNFCQNSSSIIKCSLFVFFYFFFFNETNYYYYYYKTLVVVVVVITRDNRLIRHRIFHRLQIQARSNDRWRTNFIRSDGHVPEGIIFICYLIRTYYKTYYTFSFKVYFLFLFFTNSFPK